MLKEYPETCLQNLRITMYKETLQLIMMHKEDGIHITLHFSTNIICFVIVSGYFILGFHSTRGWKLMIGSIYKDYGFAQNDQIIFGFVSIFQIILDIILKYLIYVI
ncbi:putative chloroplast envelope membrane protein, CemA [Lupinus albus]|uniref:Putative chloroplast envelope membrane protein, CemA n=1 Tax=Lupinus albus TaxID=3870 RepID=A0A6A4QVK2_LUPAL|nr:putative chloroplast envelope membrane protein, CemA [Lupinus albus]